MRDVMIPANATLLLPATGTIFPRYTLTPLQHTSHLFHLSLLRELWLSEMDDVAASIVANALLPGAAAQLEILRLGSSVTDEGGVLLAQVHRKLASLLVQPLSLRIVNPPILQNNGCIHMGRSRSTTAVLHDYKNCI